MTSQNQVAHRENEAKKRAAFYIDGFNLYHAIDEMDKPYLKWVSYYKISKILADPAEEVVKVVWCTAKTKKSPAKGDRHDRLVNAQKLEGVLPRMGHFVDETRECRNCEAKWFHPTEKEGDINVAINLLRDAFRDEFDHAYLVTADSDQAATVRMFIDEFKEKEITIVAPPGRRRSEHLYNIANNTINITELILEKAVMPEIIISPRPRFISNVRRPVEYAPPQGWVHPDKRPR